MDVNNKLNELVIQLSEAQSLADTDLSSWDINTRPGMEFKKNQAKDQLKDITYDYNKAVSDTVNKLFVSGSRDKVNRFSQMLSTEITTFTAKPFYEEIAELVQPMLNSEAFSSAAYIRLCEVLRTYAQAYNVWPSRPLAEPLSVGIVDFNGLVDTVRNIIRAAFGDTLHKAYILNCCFNEAFRIKFNEVLSVFVFTGITEDEKGALSEGLFPNQPSFSLEIGAEEEPNRSMVLKVFRKVAEANLKKLAKNSN